MALLVVTAGTPAVIAVATRQRGDHGADDTGSGMRHAVSFDDT